MDPNPTGGGGGGTQLFFGGYVPDGFPKVEGLGNENLENLRLES